MIVNEIASMSGWWSWVFLVWILPAGPIVLIFWWITAAYKLELNRRAIVTPSLDYRLVNGKIVDDPKQKSPAVQVKFQLRMHVIKGGSVFKYHSHKLLVRPFVVKTRDGKIFYIKPDANSVALHAPVEGIAFERQSQVDAGDEIWIYGSTETVRTSPHPYKKKEPSTATEKDSSLLVSTEPIPKVFLAERNRYFLLSLLLIAFLISVELIVFRDYWDIVRSGEQVTGEVIDKTTKRKTFRGRHGGTFEGTEYRILVAIDGRHKDFEITGKLWNEIDPGMPVKLMLSENTLLLGSQPYISFVRCVLIAFFLLLPALIVFVYLGACQRPWYSKDRKWRANDRPPKTTSKKKLISHK